MGKILETKINNFTGGIVNDPRNKRKNVAQVVTNFNIFETKRLTPYRDSEDGDVGSATSKKQNFALALRTGTTWSLYALGVKSGAGTAEVLYKSLTTGAGNNLSTNSWSTPSNNQSSTGAVNFNLFTYYKKLNLIFGAKGGNRIFAFSPSGTAFDDNARSITYVNIAEGLVHSKDDILYIPYDNKIAKNDNGSWTDVAITIPAHFKINSIAEFGNYLAIGVAPLSGIGNSRVYLWDRDTSLETLSENIDWGTGELKILEEVDGFLVGISDNSATATSTVFVSKIVFRFLDGNKAKKYDELITGDVDANLKIAKQKLNNRVYFMMSPTINGAMRGGVWSFGRSLVEDSFTIVHERTPNNDTVLTDGVLHNLFIVGDFMFISYTDNAVKKVSKTNDQSSFTATSIWESQIFDGSQTDPKVDASWKKDLLGITVTTEPLPANGQIILEYATDENIKTDTWTNIFTETTDNSISKSAVLPTKDYKEIEFRAESKGGAEITGLYFKEEASPKDRPYN